METGVKFTDISLGRSKERRRDDPNTFEYTYKAEITNIHRLTPKESLYRIQILDPEERIRFTFSPGQFVMLELPGIGEAPFSISSPPSRHGDVELCIRSVGNLTNFLSKVGRGARVGIRGPFGTSFPTWEMHGQNVLLVAGGLGLAPLRTPIAYVQENRSRFGDADIVYGTKDPSQLLFTYQYDMWRADDINLRLIVEKGGPSWDGPVGMITTALDEILAAKPPSYF
ncbi:MAG: FAD-binding oxidoreductase, partial [Nitrospiraceae bacterium]|nr:FAD-binding oxidoreductase [Nitrospiraceae bacterium]